ncbi:DUF4012 domain-containing protein [Microbacterium lacus]|uniref:DUF4012 domain-containing protein n=1 Tax=Microbacterium lacus TaxID=415217 RepID=UPI00384DD2AB
MTEHALPRPLRIAGGVVIIALSVMLIAVIGALAWVGGRGIVAADNLRSAQGMASDVVEQIGDPAAASETIAQISERTATAHELTSDPVWRAVETLPWLGPQLSAVSTMAAAADEIAGDGLNPLVEVAATINADALRPTGGAIALEPFVAVQDAAADAAASIGGAVDAVDRIDETALLAPLRDVVGEAQEVLTGVGDGTDALARAAVLIPAMLGADGPRNYLVLFQNNAEWRSLGGIPGAMVLLNTNGGAMQIVAQDAANDFARLDEPVFPLDPEVQAIYGGRPGMYMQNVTQVPEFSTTGPLASAMWAKKHGLEVDGVLAIDPVALSYLLRATGPITLPSGDVLTSDNAVQLLLNDVYFRFADTADQDQFFASAAQAVFAALTSGSANPAALLEALAQAGNERRVFVWSARDEDQDVLADTTIAGPLPPTDDIVSTFGVFLNDGTGSKMDFYQSVDTVVGWRTCEPTRGAQATGTAILSVSLRNNAPLDVSTLPEYVTANGWFGVTPGSASTVVYVYLPEGAELAEATLSTGDGFGGGIHQQRQVLTYEVVLAPGESATAEFAVHFDQPTGENLVVWQTPTVNGNVTTPIGACL